MSSGARDPVTVRMGSSTDVDAALSIYVRSNLVRRKGRAIPAERIEQVADNLRNPLTWFLIADAGGESVGMALSMPGREDAGAGPLIPGACYLDLIYVLPDRWGEGIGGVLLDGVLDEARRRGYRLYRSRGFVPAGPTGVNDAGDRVREWVRSIDESRPG